MKSLLYIFIGGGTGSVLRYLLTIAIQRQTGTAFPWGTFAVNFLGCILIGVFIRSPHAFISPMNYVYCSLSDFAAGSPLSLLSVMKAFNY